MSGECILCSVSHSAAPSEFILNLLGEKAQNDESDPATNLNAFLSSKLTYEYDGEGQERVVDSAGDPVMMEWETPISGCIAV